MMFCWQVRRALADQTHLRRTDSVRRHLESCPSCRTESEEQARIAGLVAESGRLPASFESRSAAVPFEQRVMAGLRERLEGLSAPPVRDPLGVTEARVPVHWAAAAALMILVTVMVIFLGDQGSSGSLSTAGTPGIVADSRFTDNDHLTDTVMPPPEIPFALRQDLVGVRTGRMPVTTYVLEPAPEEGSVMRASF